MDKTIALFVHAPNVGGVPEPTRHYNRTFPAVTPSTSLTVTANESACAYTRVPPFPIQFPSSGFFNWQEWAGSPRENVSLKIVIVLAVKTDALPSKLPTETLSIR